jgi:MFS family permease
VGVGGAVLPQADFTRGPIVWGPLSERIGRRKVLLVSFTPYLFFQVGCALAPNTAALLIFRLLGGTFAASPLSVSGGVVSDM